MCINTYSLVGEYVLYMHHIFSQQGVPDRCLLTRIEKADEECYTSRVTLQGNR
jgi:hypothetical protein